MTPLSLKAVGGAAAVYLLGQQVQCPFIAVPLIADAVAMTVAQVGSAAASFGGAIAAAHFARDLEGRDSKITAPAGVPQYNFDMCAESLADESVTVTVEGPVENHGVKIEGLPSTCMVLSNVISGDAVDGPVPTPCGSACLLYNNLNEGQYKQMQSIFNDLKNL